MREGELERLPAAGTRGDLALEDTLSRRRSIRTFRPRDLTRLEIGQLLWAAQGITAPAEGLRTAPSAGALYPLELYVATADGLFHYQAREHALRTLGRRDLRAALHRAALRQEAVREAPAVFVIAAVHARTERRYGERARRYVHIEVGHASQNLLLEATSLGLGAVPIGAFEDTHVARVLDLPRDHAPLYLIPVGQPAE